MSGIKRVFQLTTAILVVAVCLSMPAYASQIITDERDGATMTYGEQFDQIMSMIMNNYLYADDLTATELYEAALEGMFGILDDYSSYFPPEDSASFTNSLNNTYVGIGVQLIQEEAYVVVTRVFMNGPAEGAGVIVHDKIIGVNGESIVGNTTAEAASKILGDEGTEVTITIDRDGYIFDLAIVRGTVVINTVEDLSIKEVSPHMPVEIAEKIGYLRIESFSSAAADELEDLLNRYESEGKTHLLIDLRDNGGGYVDAGVAVCDLLVPAGPVLRFINKDGREIVFNSENESPTFEIVALVNENSASATEFVAKAIQETGQGVLVGETTYGKGVAQNLYNLQDGAMFKLTQEAFYSGLGEEIQGVGVTPDILVDVPDYLTVDIKYHLGDTYDQVELVESMLLFLGYDVNTPDNVYDQKTMAAITQFQEDEALYPYGVCDFTTQRTLNTAILLSMRENDVQLNKGLETITEMVMSSVGE